MTRHLFKLDRLIAHHVERHFWRWLPAMFITGIVLACIAHIGDTPSMYAASNVVRG